MALRDVLAWFVLLTSSFVQRSIEFLQIGEAHCQRAMESRMSSYEVCNLAMEIEHMSFTHDGRLFHQLLFTS